MSKEFMRLAEEEVSIIITAYAEGWGKSHYETYTTRLCNIFQQIKDGLIKPGVIENENIKV